MEDRAFNEVDLRRMLEYATGCRVDILEGRFVIEARHAGLPWEVIVEPDEVRKLLIFRAMRIRRVLGRGESSPV